MQLSSVPGRVTLRHLFFAVKSLIPHVFVTPQGGLVHKDHVRFHTYLPLLSSASAPLASPPGLFVSGLKYILQNFVGSIFVRKRSVLASFLEDTLAGYSLQLVGQHAAVGQSAVRTTAWQHRAPPPGSSQDHPTLHACVPTVTCLHTRFTAVR